MIKIKYIGSSAVRTIDDYKWDSENNFTCAVDVELAANLLTYPHPNQFEAANQTAKAADVKKLAELMGIGENEVKKMFSNAPVKVNKLTDINGLSSERATELTAVQIGTVSALAALNDKKIKELSSHVGASIKELTDWNKQAKDLMEANNG